ncbi:MAG TPA: hypothetical protein VN380_19170 [Thermoanaerobaculia bacterium]|nr:hypothetical protein [Thermoanaerobaculia bacterium]
MKRTVDDAVVAEIRAVRQELAERFGNDMNALCDFLATEEAQHEDRLVNRPPNAPQRVRATAGGRE